MRDKLETIITVHRILDILKPHLVTNQLCRQIAETTDWHQMHVKTPLSLRF